MSLTTDRRRSRARNGFTLIELLVVIAIIATLAAVVAPAVLGNVGDAKRSAAKSQIQILTLALDQYRLDNGTYPTSAQGLVALEVAPAGDASVPNWRGPYLRQAIPLDPWGRPYLFVSPGVQNPTGFDLYSLGNDGRAGGTGDDADVTSWGGPIQQ